MYLVYSNSPPKTNHDELHDVPMIPGCLVRLNAHRRGFDN